MGGCMSNGSRKAVESYSMEGEVHVPVPSGKKKKKPRRVKRRSSTLSQPSSASVRGSSSVRSASLVSSTATTPKGGGSGVCGASAGSGAGGETGRVSGKGGGKRKSKVKGARRKRTVTIEKHEEVIMDAIHGEFFARSQVRCSFTFGGRSRSLRRKQLEAKKTVVVGLPEVMFNDQGEASVDPGDNLDSLDSCQRDEWHESRSVFDDEVDDDFQSVKDYFSVTSGSRTPLSEAARAGVFAQAARLCSPGTPIAIPSVLAAEGVPTMPGLVPNFDPNSVFGSSSWEGVAERENHRTSEEHVHVVECVCTGKETTTTTVMRRLSVTRSCCANLALCEGEMDGGQPEFELGKKRSAMTVSVDTWTPRSSCGDGLPDEWGAEKSNCAKDGEAGRDLLLCLPRVKTLPLQGGLSSPMKRWACAKNGKAFATTKSRYANEFDASPAGNLSTSLDRSLNPSSTSEPIFAVADSPSVQKFPFYEANIWPSCEADGDGFSLVFYFQLNEQFLKSAPEEAMAVLKKFMEDDVEQVPGILGANTVKYRDQLKVVARIANLDEVYLSNTEKKLVSNYNEKPVLSRPQHVFYQGKNYMEVDIDIHRFSYLARKGLDSFRTRLKSMVIDVGIVLQLMTPHELRCSATGDHAILGGLYFMVMKEL
ncbi:hypothetical protein CBR_g45482 [Chara braunii]|uniref:Protein ENHANCED DISEASE RESISTANCE 2 C-terminal domain-containing protein n=1 Tax=Chara braunii TaxID=69332 RepID=A0A388LYS8_CHABU|nr:hypothetical protein CBR_g45482 [Chara braunii]|eukprot:GBG87425.1 hypothetical protein CBR_g45482 [Chara braunii]